MPEWILQKLEVENEKQDGGRRHLEFYKSRYNSVKYEPIVMKFERQVQKHMPDLSFEKPEVEN